MDLRVGVSEESTGDALILGDFLLGDIGEDVGGFLDGLLALSRLADFLGVANLLDRDRGEDGGAESLRVETITNEELVDVVAERLASPTSAELAAKVTDSVVTVEECLEHGQIGSGAQQKKPAGRLWSVCVEIGLRLGDWGDRRGISLDGSDGGHFIYCFYLNLKLN